MFLIKDIIEELKSIITDRDVIILLIGAPVFLTLLFAGVYSHTYIEDIPVAVLDDDNSSISRSIVYEFDNHERFYVKHYAESTQELKHLIDSREVQMGIYIPYDFSKDLNSLKPTEVMVMVDGTNIVTGNNSYAAAASIIQTIAAGTQVKLLQAKGVVPQQAFNMAMVFHFTDRMLYDPKLTYMNYLILGFVAVFLQQVMLSSVGISVIKKGCDMVKGNMVYRLSIRVLCCGLLALASTFTALGILYRFFNVPFRGSMPAALLMCILFSVAVSWPAVIIASLTKEKIKFAQVAFMLSMPTLISCGYVWPQEQMPQLLVLLIKGLWPLINFARPFDEIIIKGLSLVDVRDNIIQLICYSIFWAPVAMLVMRKKFGDDVKIML